MPTVGLCEGAGYGDAVPVLCLFKYGHGEGQVLICVAGTDCLAKSVMYTTDGTRSRMSYIPSDTMEVGDLREYLDGLPLSLKEEMAE